VSLSNNSEIRLEGVGGRENGKLQQQRNQFNPDLQIERVVGK
jgi:hypothetical protein